VLSAALLVDDAFLLHDEVLPLHLGWPEEVLYAAYALAFLLYFRRFGSFVLRHTPFRKLAVAFGLLGLSCLMDLNWFPGGTGVEDLLKFLGIGCFAQYYVVTARRLQRDASSSA
jgi:hypothetical protein